MKYILFYIILFQTISGYAQITVDKNWQKALQSFEKRNFADAIYYFEKTRNTIQNDTVKACIYYEKLAQANAFLGKEEEAIYNYSKQIKQCITSSDDLFKYGLLLMQTGNYDKAKKVFTIYQNQQKNDDRAEKAIINCDSAISWQNTPKYTIQNMVKLNSSNDELGLQISTDKFYFSSSREGFLIKEKKGINHQPSLSIYETMRMNEMKKTPRKSAIFAQKTLNASIISFNFDFSEVYFTAENQETGKLQIYKSVNNDGKFVAKESFIYNSDSASFAQTCLSADGNTLFFVSDMKGGFGGTDIYFCSKKNGKWSPPINLGPEVNSAANELFPYLYNGKTLYFSSNGHLGMGGYDIFKTTLKDNKWTQIENMKSPINSPKDDMCIIFENSSKGYISSNRKQGKGGLDIYFFEKW